MTVLESLKALRNEFVALSAQSARARFAREAAYLDDVEIGVRCGQLEVAQRRLSRELAQTNVGGASRAHLQEHQKVRNIEAQRYAMELARVTRAETSQGAAVFP